MKTSVLALPSIAILALLAAATVAQAQSSPLVPGGTQGKLPGKLPGKTNPLDKLQQGGPIRKPGEIGTIKKLQGCMIRTSCTGGKRPDARTGDPGRNPKCEYTFMTFDEMAAQGISQARCEK